MRRSAARLCAILLCLTGLPAVLAAPASAAAASFAVQITELPGEFAAGAGPETVTVVATQRAGQECLKVRWSMVMQVTGMRLDQITVARVEDDGPFPLSVRTDGDTARLTDVQLDPGTLCPDRTVTARYEMAVDDEVDDGTVTLLAEAYDADEQLLQRATARRDVASGQLQPSPAEPSPEASQDDTGGIGDDGPEQTDEAAADAPGGGIQRNTTLPASGVTASSDSGLAKVGLAVGGVFIFLGVSVLMRLRRRGRETDDQIPGRFSAYRRRRRFS